MKFIAEKIDLSLELESEEGETRVFEPKERATASFAEHIDSLSDDYLSTQRSLPDKEKDSITNSNLKLLSWIYKELDIQWIKDNFPQDSIGEMAKDAVETLRGVKKNKKK